MQGLKNIQHHTFVFSYAHINPLKIMYLKPQVTQILSMGFSDLYNLKQLANKIFISLFLQKFNYCLNNKTDVVVWADHKFSTKSSIKTFNLSVDSNSTGLKTP